MIFIIIILVIFILEICLKNYFDKTLIHGEEKSCLHGHIILNKFYNEGAALNILEKFPKLLKYMTGCMVVGLMVSFIHRLRNKRDTIGKLGYAFTIGGALSNLYDRIDRKHVVDYFSFSKLKHIVFNIADMFIFLGMLLILLSSFKKKKN